MLEYYILDGKKTVKVDLLTWAEWFETANRRVALNKIGIRLQSRAGKKSGKDKVLRVSTVFLGLDHNYGEGPPHIFETMVLDDRGHGYTMARCSTYEEAEEQHRQMVEHVRFFGV